MRHAQARKYRPFLLIMNKNETKAQPDTERAQDGQKVAKNGTPEQITTEQSKGENAQSEGAPATPPTEGRRLNRCGRGIGRPFTSENAREMAYKAHEAIREKKRGRELLTLILQGHTIDPDTLKEFERLGIDAEQATNEAALYLAMFRQAMAGDRESPRAFEQIAKVMGWQLERHEISGPDGAPLIPPRTLTPSEVADLLQDLERNT